jgi:AraC-like DNA-binding protein
MILVEKKPIDTKLVSFIDLYQCAVVEGPTTLVTVPNNKIDALIVIHGELVLETDHQRYSVTDSIFFPLMNSPMKIHIRDNSIVFNIKFSPFILSTKSLEEQKKSIYFSKLTTVLKQADYERLKGYLESSNGEFDVHEIDSLLLDALDLTISNHFLFKLLKTVSMANHVNTVQELSFLFNVSVKTIERVIRESFNLRAKSFLNIIRFNSSKVRIAHKTDKQINLISHHYYDQSHFIKTCKNFTEYTPKRLIPLLIGDSLDIISVKDAKPLKK